MRRKLALVVAAAAALWLAPGALAAGWCGSGESASDRPPAVAGQQFHAIVAAPSGAPDTFVDDANRLADDVDSLTAWWQGQDPTRAPRFDLAVFGGATCLDISYVRLPFGATPAPAPNTLYRALVGALQSAGFDDQFERYLVYYDGASSDQNTCGSGTPEAAVVWLGACTTIEPKDAVAAHEMLHALGALPPGAPHACTAATDPFGVDDPGHPCDSPTDILYPATTGLPIAQQVLDYHHDDYYELATNGIDIRNSLWLRHLDTPEVPLTVGISGTGHVTSEEPGVDCTATCTTQWDQGWQVQLQAIDTSTTRFVSWRGACTGRTSTCDVSLDAAASVTAVFGPLKIPVRVSVGGRGSVTCTPRCSRTFVAGDPLTLRAVAAKGWRFARWTGACTGTRPVCRPATDYAVTARAVFTRRR